MNQARNVLQFTIWYQITEKGKVMEDRYLFKAKTAKSEAEQKIKERESESNVDR